VGVADILKRGAEELGIELDARAIELFERYYRELAEWNRRMNLTSIEGEEEVAIKHFLDSLTCLLAVDLWGGCSVVDVGSGAGFPGVVLKVARPEIRLTLVEASRKKAEFLRKLASVLEIEDVEVLWDRAERVGQTTGYREAFDVATARGVADMAALVEVCLPLVKVGGVFVAMKGPDVGEEIAGAMDAVEVVGGRVARLVSVALPSGYGGRTLSVINKERRTPGRYPRRPGIPGKRPIRGPGGL
jgi:16S rRNA (guanine527-N7)-methyltransferase